MTDFAARRTMMVDTQVRPSDVTKFPIIDAMLSVPREVFVPRARQDAAYLGDNIDLGKGRVMLEPRTLAKMLDAVDIKSNDLVLNLGAGRADAQSALSDVSADNVILHEGALADGAPEHGPYDVIVIQGAVETLPEGISAQLKEGGRIVALFAEGRLGTVRVGYCIDGAISWRFAFNAGAPVLPGFQAERAFAL